ncbi:MAG: LacI family transcriptional regulator [Bacteroidetes bacterium]|nr:LacI family transcriptional regulator [Bacteroidota bacterium]
MKKASLQDIATSLKVSKSLVSFVINGLGDEKGIKSETQQRVLKRARELNYKPNFIARGLRLGKSNTIGLIVADISNNFYAKIARRVEEVASARGYNVIFCSSDEDEKKEVGLIEMLRERQVDGLLISTTQKGSSFFTQLKKEQFPFVLFDRQLPRLNTNYVGVANFEAARDAVDLLIRNRYHQIGLLKISPSHLSSVREREAGYREALKNNGLRFHSDLVKEISYENIYNETHQALTQWVQRELPVGAIFTINNNIAVACLETLRTLHMRIPDDVALISFDDIDLFRLVHPSITALAQPVEDIGERAVNILLDLIEDENQQKMRHEILPARLISRGSCVCTKPDSDQPVEGESVLVKNKSEHNHYVNI